jgi:hypothetical protein
MDRIGRLKQESKQEFPVVSSQVTPVTPDNIFLLLPVEIVIQILDEVLLFKDQLAFMLCSIHYRQYAGVITQTYLHGLREPVGARPPENVLGSMVKLKYLCIENCHIPTTKFASTELKGLRVRRSNIDSSLLTDQCSLAYLDLRTIDPSQISTQSFAYLGLDPEMPTRSIFSCESPDVLATLKVNHGLQVLKLNLTGTALVNIYSNLTALQSLELVDLKDAQSHASFLITLTSLQDIVISSYETGLMEGTYAVALKTLAQLPDEKTVTLSCLNPKQISKITYDCQQLKRITAETTHVM